MTCSGIKTDLGLHSPRDLSTDYFFNENLSNLISEYLINNVNNKIEFTVSILSEDNTFISKITYISDIIEEDGSYYMKSFNPSELFSNFVVISLRPINYENTYLILNNFNQEDCEKYGLDYFSIEVDE